jgi:hypothetical protein
MWQLPYFSANSICNCLVVLLFAMTERLAESYRKYAPGMTAAMRSRRCRASERPSTHSSQTASLSEVPEKISNVGSLMGNQMPGRGSRLRNFGWLAAASPLAMPKSCALRTRARDAMGALESIAGASRALPLVVSANKATKELFRPLRSSCRSAHRPGAAPGGLARRLPPESFASRGSR